MLNVTWSVYYPPEQAWQFPNNPVNNAMLLQEHVFSDNVPSHLRDSRRTASIAQREAVFARDGKKCKVCGSILNLCIDHIIPHAKGGLSVLRNYQVLCWDCNSKKSDKMPDFITQHSEGV